MNFPDEWRQVLNDSDVDPHPRFDQDEDGFVNAEENRVGSRNDLLDTDDDGIEDSVELPGTHPNFSMSGADLTARAMDLSGQAVIPVAERFDRHGGSWTVEAWVNLASAAESGIIIQSTIERRVQFELGITQFDINDDDSMEDNVPYILFQDNRIEPRTFTVFGGFPIPAEEWTHLAGVWDGDNEQLMLLVNGFSVTDYESQNEDDAIRTLSGITPVIAGNDATTGDFTASVGDGNFSVATLVDEIRVWSVAQSRDEIVDGNATAVTANADDLLAYYRFDDGGDTVEDFAWMLYHRPGSATNIRSIWSLFIAEGDTEATEQLVNVEYEGFRFVLSDVLVVEPTISAPIIDADFDAITFSINVDDVDDDDIPDWFEDLYSGGFAGIARNSDADSDGLTALYEFMAHTNPNERDTDNDRVGDGDEDADGDGLANIEEQTRESFANLTDTDDDGVIDGDDVDPVDSLNSFTNRSLSLSSAAGNWLEFPQQSRFEIIENFILEAWINLDATEDGNGILISRRHLDPSGNPDNNQLNYELGLDNFQPYVRFVNADGLERRAQTSRSITTDTWFSLAGIFDGDEQTLSVFINGREEFAIAVNGITPDIDPPRAVLHRIGEGIDGLIDEVRIWENTPGIQTFQIGGPLQRSSNQRIDGLVAFYPFDDGTGGQPGDDGLWNTADPNESGLQLGQIQDFRGDFNEDWSTGWLNAATLVGQASIITEGAPVSEPNFDTDNDGIPDWWEIQFFGNLTETDGSQDSDDDELTDLYEFLADLDPTKPRTENDGVDDGDRDGDGDGLTNLQEQDHKTMPHLVDTDDDDLNDGEEVTGINDFGGLTTIFDPDGRFSDPINSLSPQKELALEFDGIDDFVSIRPQRRHSVGEWTLEAWIRPNSEELDGGIIIRREVAANVVNFELGLEVDGGQLIPYAGFDKVTNDLPDEIDVKIGGTRPIVQAQHILIAGKNRAIPTDDWTHIAATADPNNNQMKLFINGELVFHLVNMFDEPFVGLGITGSLTIGGSDDPTEPSSRFIQGLVDDVRIWASVRTETEIVENFNTSIESSTVSSPITVPLRRESFVPAPGLDDLVGLDLDTSINVLIQLTTELTSASLQILNNAGIGILKFVAPRVYVARGTPAQIEGVGNLIRWSGNVPTETKISTFLEPENLAGQNVLVEFYQITPEDRAKAVITELGLTLLNENYINARYLEVKSNGAGIQQLSQQNEVVYLHLLPDSLISVEEPRFCTGPLVNGFESAPFATLGVGWDGPGLGGVDLQYIFLNGTDDISGTAENDVVIAAMEKWNAVSSINFTETNVENADFSMDIGWFSGDHGDGSPFDGVFGVLAHGFFPNRY